MNMQRTSGDSATLQGVCDRLDIVISLLMPAANQREDGPKGLQFDILKLCDYDHTTEEICKSLNKSSTHVNKELSGLRAKGLIRTVRRESRLVHIRLN